MKKSTHRVDIVKICPEKHPNADSLVIQRVYGYQVQQDFQLKTNSETTVAIST